MEQLKLRFSEKVDYAKFLWPNLNICMYFTALWQIVNKLFRIFVKGSLNNYVDRILSFLTPCPPAWTVLYPERGQKLTFFDPLPPTVQQGT